MIKFCKKCNLNITIPTLTEEEKLELYALKDSNFSLFFIDKIMKISSLNSKEAKILNKHLNTNYGKCFNCNYDNLINENTDCPKCNAFNLNWKLMQSFNFDFCNYLEYYLSDVFYNSNNPKLNGFWCDGISNIPFNITECSINNIQKYKRIITKTYSGKSGQDIYELTILLGNKSLDNFINGFSLIDDLPDSKIDDWIDFDFLNRKILIRLL